VRLHRSMTCLPAGDGGIDEIAKTWMQLPDKDPYHRGSVYERRGAERAEDLAVSVSASSMSARIV